MESAAFVNVSLFKENDSQCFNVPLSHTVVKKTKKTHFLDYNGYQVKPRNIHNLMYSVWRVSNDCAMSSVKFF